MLINMVSPLAVDVKGGVIEDCGHYVMEEQPDAVAGWWLDFFRRVDKNSLSCDRSIIPLLYGLAGWSNSICS